MTRYLYHLSHLAVGILAAGLSIGLDAHTAALEFLFGCHGATKHVTPKGSDRLDQLDSLLYSKCLYR